MVGHLLTEKVFFSNINCFMMWPLHIYVVMCTSAELEVGARTASTVRPKRS